MNCSFRMCNLSASAIHTPWWFHSNIAIKLIMSLFRHFIHIYSRQTISTRNEPHHEKTGLFCICENKDADQLRGNREADQRLFFRYMESIILLVTSKIRNFKPLAIFRRCTARFVWDLVGNPEDRFSHNEAQMVLLPL